MMPRWLESVPKTVFALAVILAVVVFLMVNDPPRTLCDAQVAQFRESQTGFLFRDPKDKYRTEIGYMKQRDFCQRSNSEGSCYNFFQNMNKFADEVSLIAPECLGEVASLREVSGPLWSTLDLMVRLAWVANSDSRMVLGRQGWFGHSQMATYCRLKSLAQRLYPEARWSSFRESFFTSGPDGVALVGADKMTREEVWSHLLLSADCALYR